MRLAQFLNRNEAVIFRSLSKADLRGIVRLEMKSLAMRLQDKDIELVVSEKALDYLAESGYDGVMGARPLKRVIQRVVEKPVAKLILGGGLADGAVVAVGVDENERITVDVQ